MANVTYSAGIDHVSGALSKPGKSGQHSCEKMLLATHRTAATTSNKCNRLYLRTPQKRTSPLTNKEFENRAKFMVVAGMIPHEDHYRPAELPRPEERPRWRKNHEGVLLEDLRGRVRRAALVSARWGPRDRCMVYSVEAVYGVQCTV